METSDSQRDELNLIFKEENLGLDIEDIVLHQEDLNNFEVKDEFEKSSEPSVGEPLSKKRKSNPSSSLIGEGVMQSLRLNSIEKEVILIKIKQNQLSNQLNKTQSLLQVLLKQVSKNQELLEIVISNQTTNQFSGSSGPIISSVEGQFENAGAEDSGPISDDDDVIAIDNDVTDCDAIDSDVIIGATPEPDLPISRPSSPLDTRVQTILKDGSRSPRRNKPSKRSRTGRAKKQYTFPLASKPASTSVMKDSSSRLASGPASTTVMKDASSRFSSGPAIITVKKDSSSPLASKPASSTTVAKGNRFSIEPGVSPLRDTRTFEDAEGVSKEDLEENAEPVAHTSKDSFPAKDP